MIIFNTIKKAEHYVKWYSKKYDFYRDGYDWETSETYIEGNFVVIRHQGDGCGCGCDNHLFDYTIILGRIKDQRHKKLKQVLDTNR